MQKIYFTQYLRPDGRKQAVAIERPDNIAAIADNITRHGFKLECEELREGTVSLTITDNDQGDFAIELVPNGTGVPAAVDKLLTEFDLPKMIEQRKRNRAQSH